MDRRGLGRTESKGMVRSTKQLSRQQPVVSWSRVVAVGWRDEVVSAPPSWPKLKRCGAARTLVHCCTSSFKMVSEAKDTCVLDQEVPQEQRETTFPGSQLLAEGVCWLWPVGRG